MLSEPRGKDKLTAQVRKTLIPDAGQLEALLFSMACEIEQLREKVRRFEDAIAPADIRQATAKQGERI